EIPVIDGVHTRAAADADLAEITRPVVPDDAVHVFPFDWSHLTCGRAFCCHRRPSAMTFTVSYLGVLRKDHFMAAMKIQIPIVNPMPILRTVDTTRPINAPLATRVASPADDPPVNSAMSAPTKEPTNAPMTGPTIGTGNPTIAPTMLPITAPHPARREPPYFRA